MTVTVNTEYYRGGMIPSSISGIIIDALTRERPATSNVDIEKAIGSGKETTLCKSRPVRIGLPTLCWCILLVVCAIQFLMYLDSLLILLHDLGLGPS